MAEQKRKVYLLNALPVGALPQRAAVLIAEIGWEHAKVLAKSFAEMGYEFVSYIGHQSTAELVSKELGIPAGVNRAEAKLEYDAHALIFALAKRVSGDVQVAKDDIKVYHALILEEEACLREH